MSADLKIYADEVEQEALDQIHAIEQLMPFEGQRVRIMPDTHAGKGCVIGFTSTFTDKIIVNLVGVDGSCGVHAIELANEVTPELLERLDVVAHERIPMGNSIHQRTDARSKAMRARLRCNSRIGNHDRIDASIGTLGGGNHYIEAEQDSSGKLWLCVHSGSRNLGVQVADFYQKLAVKDMDGVYGDYDKSNIASIVAAYKAAGREREIEAAIKEWKDIQAAKNRVPDDLCWLSGEHLEDYLHDVDVVAEWADLNRRAMLTALVEGCCLTPTGRSVVSVHNYVDTEHRVIRKGAIAAYAGDEVIIPLNMRDGCVVGRGLGNGDWNCSAPHGAGRKMSRKQARAQLDLAEYERTMGGIYTTSVCESTIDEAPMAYKDASSIIDQIDGTTIAVTERLVPVWNCKAK